MPQEDENDLVARIDADLRRLFAPVQSEGVVSREDAWTKVSSKLPEINGVYLCKWRCNERVLCLMQETPGMEDSFKAFPYWWDENADQEIEWEDVTEWRHLPQPVAPVRGGDVVDNDKKAGEYLEKVIWDFIDTNAMFPKAHPDSRSWEHLWCYVPEEVKAHLTTTKSAPVAEQTTQAHVKALKDALYEAWAMTFKGGHRMFPEYFDSLMFVCRDMVLNPTQSAPSAESVPTVEELEKAIIKGHSDYYAESEVDSLDKVYTYQAKAIHALLTRQSDKGGV